MVLTVYGAFVFTFMMVIYAQEGRDRQFVLAFPLGCALAGSYGIGSGAWPFGVMEVIWCGAVLRRFFSASLPPPRPIA